MPRHLLPILLIAALAGSACALPQGSFGRPVEPAADGALLLSGGVMMPLYVAAGVAAKESAFTSASTQQFSLIPGASFDFAYDKGYYFGVGLATYTPAFIGGKTADLDFLAVFLNPRWEVPLSKEDRHLSLTIDGNLGWLRARTGDTTLNLPYFSPTIGLRAYVPTGFGGAVVSQQIGTGFVTVILPGSLAYDFPIPLGDTAKLHLFPELRWDPTGIFSGSGAVFFVFVSGGLSFMFEI